MFVPSTSNPDNIVRYTQEPEWYINARNPPAHHESQISELSTQPDLRSMRHKDEIEQPMEVPKVLFYRSEQHSLLVNELNHIVATLVKETMIQGIEESFAAAFELGF